MTGTKNFFDVWKYAVVKKFNILKNSIQNL